MYTKNISLLYLSLLFICCLMVNSFIPIDINKHFPEIYNDSLKDTLGRIDSPTLSHQQILRIGVLNSVEEFLIDKGFQVNKTIDYLVDVYTRPFVMCQRGLRSVIEQMDVAVGSVDFNPSIRLYPPAHFDAEMFQESNQRVYDAFNQIVLNILENDFFKARFNIGEILHTVHDFYAHSNWVEMNEKEINPNIGNAQFDFGVPIADKSDNATCIDSNCERIEEDCTPLLESLKNRFKRLKGKGFEARMCPLVYYKCRDNVVTDKLTSGYYKGEKLQDGTPVNKPNGKCSHGGVFDDSAFDPPEGGINKDASFYAFSPHAHLHIAAAQLAIRHTQFFIDRIREAIGDSFYVKLFDLDLKKKC